jgi:hypothetical protein
MSVCEETVDAVVEPVAGEFFVEEGIVRGKREPPDIKQTQSQPQKQGRRDMFVRGSREPRFGKGHQVLVGGYGLLGRLQRPRTNGNHVLPTEDAPGLALKDNRKKRWSHCSQRNGRTNSIVRSPDSRNPFRLDRWIRGLEQLGQLIDIGEHRPREHKPEEDFATAVTA